MAQRPEHAGGAQIETRIAVAYAAVERMGRPVTLGVIRRASVSDDLVDRCLRGGRVPRYAGKRRVPRRIKELARVYFSGGT
jgi:hypothetical protein